MPTGIAVKQAAYNIRNGSIVDEYCVQDPVECCAPPPSCAELPNYIFLTFHYLNTPPAAVDAATPYQEVSTSSTMGFTNGTLDNYSVLLNKSYRLRKVLTLNPSDPPAIQRHMYILADSVVVGGDAIIHETGQLQPATDCDPGTGCWPAGTLVDATERPYPGVLFDGEAIFTTSSGGGYQQTWEYSRGIWLSPVNVPFTIPCSVTGILSGNTCWNSNEYGLASLGDATVNGPIYGAICSITNLTCPGAAVTYHSVGDTVQAQMRYGSTCYVIPPAQSTSHSSHYELYLNDSGFPGVPGCWGETLLYTQDVSTTAYSSGPTVDYRVYQQLYVILGCTGDPDNPTPSISVKFDTYIVYQQTGVHGFSADITMDLVCPNSGSTYCNGACHAYQELNITRNQYGINRITNWTGTYDPGDWTGEFPYVSIRDTSQTPDVFITLST